MGPGWRVAVIAATVLSTGCLVETEKVSDPGPAFAAARREAARAEGRSGPPSRLQVLVYDRDDGELVRASLPMWIVEKADDEEVDLDLGDEAEGILHRIRASDLQDAPLGPLVEVVEEDGDQVLVWLQ